jgi:tubulin alpha
MGVLDEGGTGSCGDLWHPEMVTGREDAANDDVRGHYTVGTELVNLMLDGSGNLADWCTRCRAS